MDLFMQDSPSGASYAETLGSGSAFTTTPYPTQTRDSPPSNSIPTTSAEETQPKKRGRKGHSKSRTGCYNCKRARIKCKENRPQCDYCSHRDLKCEWPDLQISQLGAIIRKPSDSSSVATSSGRMVATSPIPFAIQSNIPVFTMQDFRLFNFFIQSAYPHQPIGNDAVWKHEIPSIASDYDFLLHSMLGLSASELACSTDPTPQMYSTALAHRVKAITSLNAAITKGISGFEEGNAMLATCYSLLFQSCLLEDGLVEFMTFIRGTLCIGIQMGTRQMRFLFEKIFEDEQVEQVDPAMKAAPLIQPQVVAGACRSFERFAHLCVSKIEIDVYTILLGIARALITSSRDAYMNLRKMYELFSYTMTQEEFHEYCNPSNEACKILQAHFVALQLIMSPITKNEWATKENETGQRDGHGKTVMWLVGLHRRAPAHMLRYYQWTLWVQQEVLNGNIYNGRVGEDALEGLEQVLTVMSRD